MKFLSWYTLVVNSLGILALIISMIAGNSTDLEGDMYGVLFFAPCIVYLILVQTKGKVK